MKNIIITAIVILQLAQTNASPLHINYKHSIIIDTDCAIDDMRAIGLLLSLPDITIKAIMVSGGSIPPNEGAIKVKSILKEFQSDPIPVICGAELEGINPAWREFNSQLNWGKTVQPTTINYSLEDVNNIIKNSTEPITLICLGPLSNLARLIKNNPELKNNIEEIIWYNESGNPLKGFNYECDIKAAEYVIASKVEINILSNPGDEKLVFDTSMQNICLSSNTTLARALYNVHNQPEASEKLKQNHFRLWDELAVIFLTNPELFEMEPLYEKKNVRISKGCHTDAIIDVYEDIITGRYKAGEYVAFYGFPAKKEMFVYDVRMILDQAIAKYGIDEWEACVITDEFHGHLGIFSIVGAKMGIRAREYFGVGTDKLSVISFAGKEEPFSCLNDGIQVSTGATLGLGAIEVRDDSIARPSAIFTHNGNSVIITLKNTYLEQIKASIRKGTEQYGLTDEGYWHLVRQNALKYWLEWDRNEIFDVCILNTANSK
jgi:inosine-uridine nucleoside N-ribohydrolase/formylmethanofuran dehydrogenase subunit E